MVPLKNAKWRTKNSMAEEECVIASRTEFSMGKAMTGGLGIEILARRKTNPLTDSLASLGNCDLSVTG